MAIFEHPDCFVGYVSPSIEPSLMKSLRLGWAKLNRRSPEQLFTRLACFLEITDASLTRADLKASGRRLFVDKAIGAFYSPIFHAIHARGHERSYKQSYKQSYQLSRLLLLTLEAAGMLPKCHIKPLPVDPKPEAEVLRLAKQFEETKLNEERVRFWRGWSMKNRDGKVSCLRLHGAYTTTGPKFTEDLHIACASWFAANSADRIPCFNHLAEYIHQHQVKEDLFKCPNQTGELLRKFFCHFVSISTRNGKRVPTIFAEWRTFRIVLYRHVLGKIWANAEGGIPNPARRKVRGASTNIRRVSGARDVKKTLVTDLPLSEPDQRTAERLLEKVESDVAQLRRWAELEVREADRRFDESTAPRWPFSSQELARILKKRLQSSRSAETKNRSIGDAARELGLPTPELLLAFGCLLVINHPQITPAFLSTCELFDDTERRVGLIDSGDSQYLVGQKPRKGSNRSFQSVKLNAETRNLLAIVEKITEPLRRFLRARKDPNWRRLLLAVVSVGGVPRPWEPTKAAHRASKWLAGAMTEKCGTDAAVAAALAANFTLRRLRASCGVLVYLRTGSVQMMAEALGHEQWHPSLLDHYLPRPIQDYFVERWIRLFQCAIVCFAMKDSPLLLVASDLATVEELDSFLQSHMIKLHAKEKPPTSPDPRKVYFSISESVVTVLLSIKMAVEENPSLASARASRWARFSERLQPYLESSVEFRDIAAAALRKASPSLVRDITYG